MTQKILVCYHCYAALVKSCTKLSKRDNLTEKQEDDNGEVDEGELL